LIIRSTRPIWNVLRFAHFLALAAITVRFLLQTGPDCKSRWLRPVILCGQHCWRFSASGFLAFCRAFHPAEVARRCRMRFRYHGSGIILMCAAHGLFFRVQGRRRQGRNAR